jgi:hypothetical protein
MRFYKNFLVYWCVAYLIIAFVGRFTSSKKEYFPFFRWSLYSKTPNTLNQAYILVEKIGDSIVQPPVDLRDLYGYHHINSVDMNLIVQDFYSKVKTDGYSLQDAIFTILPQASIFQLYETTADLSIEDYKSSLISNKILTFKNDTFYFE